MKFQHLERVRLAAHDPDKKVGTVQSYTRNGQVRILWDNWSVLSVYLEAELEHAI